MSDLKTSPRGPDDISDDSVIISSDTRRANRVPPNQARVKNWPVLHATTVPEVTTDSWSLTIGGLVKTPLTLDWQQYQELPRVKVFSDFHCVTKWSKLANMWEGVSVHEIMRHCGVQPEAKFVIAGGYDSNWTTNIPIDDFKSADVLLVDSHDGTPINADHGGPVRLVVPLLYAWKSAKWLKSLTFVAEDQPGYWEAGGYHLVGDPWQEQRFRDDPDWLATGRPNPTL